MKELRTQKCLEKAARRLYTLPPTQASLSEETF